MDQVANPVGEPERPGLRAARGEQLGQRRLAAAPRGQGDSRLYLPRLIGEGLSVRSIDALALSIDLDDTAFKYRIVPKATLNRRKKSGSRRLSVEEGDRLVRLAKAFSFAIEIYGGTAGAKAFMTAGHPMLDDRAPMDVALATGAGAGAVVQLLGRMACGGGV